MIKIRKFTNTHINKLSLAKLKHGKCHSPIYCSYAGAKTRCNNIKNKDYKMYGGRGIKMEWASFKDFFTDMGETYKLGLTLERIDVNGNYCKENCKWADRKAQANNRTNSRLFEYNGEVKTISQWAEYLNMERYLINNRLLRGWGFKRAITK